MPLTIFALCITAIAFLIFREARRGSDQNGGTPTLPAHNSALVPIADNPLDLAVLLSFASLSHRQKDSALTEDIYNNVLLRLASTTDVQAAMDIGRSLYERINDRVLIIDEGTYFLNRLIPIHERQKFFMLIKTLHDKHENDNGISFYLQRLERKLEL